MRVIQKTVDFYKTVSMEAEKRGSLYSGSCADMRKLDEFLDMNDWFGMRAKTRGKSRDASEGRGLLMVDDGAAA